MKHTPFPKSVIALAVVLALICGIAFLVTRCEKETETFSDQKSSAHAVGKAWELAANIAEGDYRILESKGMDTKGDGWEVRP